HTEVFLGLVAEFCAASGMRLNTDKTVVLPFRPWTETTEALRQSLVDLGIIVVGNEGQTKFLGIYYGPNLSDADRLQHLLTEMQTRCSLWVNRARTLRGQAVILQQIILPVLWYSASVCHVPPTGFQDRLHSLIARFVCRDKSSNALPQAWWFLPPGQGGLGITPVADMIRSLQLHMLCKVIIATRQTLGRDVPSWVEPIIRLFDQAVQPWGRDFDILYAPVNTSPDYVVARRLTRWTGLGAYWHFVLFCWNTQFRPKTARLQLKADKRTTPLMDNVDITYGPKGRTLVGTSAPLGMLPILANHSLYRPVDFMLACETPVTAASLSELLRQIVQGRISSVRSCTNFLDKVGRFFVEAPIGPQVAQYYCAFHTWVFDAYDLEELTVARIRTGLLKCEVPALPLDRLGVEGSPPDAMWSRDLKLGKHLLPVYADLLYRLQHNALFLGYRFQHRTDSQTQCHHGCGALETAPHLFWFCSAAIEVWDPWLPAFQVFFDSKLEWENILLFKVEPKPEAK
ncbi:hypothetical protein PHYSODRAFT_461533, partial [Phytophthora sojae]